MRSQERNQTYRERRKLYRAIDIEKGRCPVCGKSATDGFKLCEGCRKWAREEVKARRKADPETHRAKARAYEKHKRATDPAYLERAREHQRKHYRKVKKAKEQQRRADCKRWGICTTCRVGNRAAEGRTRCETCLAKDRAKWHQRKKRV